MTADQKIAELTTQIQHLYIERYKLECPNDPLMQGCVHVDWVQMLMKQKVEYKAKLDKITSILKED